MEEAGRSRRGYVPVLVGTGKDLEKIWVTIKEIQHLTVVELLEKSANEYGYQNGLLKITCDATKFKTILHNISKK